MTGVRMAAGYANSVQNESLQAALEVVARPRAVSQLKVE
jgi:hypothetical protein